MDRWRGGAGLVLRDAKVENGSRRSCVKSYIDLFGERGAPYDQAMQRWPDARRQEFEQVIRAVPLEDGMVVADVPAGGGYLQRYLPSYCTWQGHEPCAAFSNHKVSPHALHERELLPLPWIDQSVDVVISLAGVHHLTDKRPLFAEVLRVTRPGGWFVLSDVAAESDAALFLNGFVDAHNSTGHEGVFLDRSTFDELTQAGWTILSDQLLSFHWVFPQRADMAGFCRRLFDIRNAATNEVQKALEEDLGVDVLHDGSIGLRWSLMTIVAKRPADG